MRAVRDMWQVQPVGSHNTENDIDVANDVGNIPEYAQKIDRRSSVRQEVLT